MDMISNKIDTTSFDHGIYFLVVEHKISRKTFKLIKN